MRWGAVGAALAACAGPAGPTSDVVEVGDCTEAAWPALPGGTVLVDEVLSDRAALDVATGPIHDEAAYQELAARLRRTLPLVDFGAQVVLVAAASRSSSCGLERDAVGVVGDEQNVRLTLDARDPEGSCDSGCEGISVWVAAVAVPLRPNAGACARVLLTCDAES